MLLNVSNARKNPGVKTGFEYSFKPENSLLNNSEAKFSGSAVFNGSYYYSNGSVFVKGVIGAEIIYPCDRCLKPVLYNLNIDFDEVFYKEAERVEDYAYDGMTVDLSKPASDYIILNLPAGIICNEGCKGLCPVCGADKNVKDCGCINDETETKNNPFADIFKDKK